MFGLGQKLRLESFQLELLVAFFLFDRFCCLELMQSYTQKLETLLKTQRVK